MVQMEPKIGKFWEALIPNIYIFPDSVGVQNVILGTEFNILRSPVFKNETF